MNIPFISSLLIGKKRDSGWVAVDFCAHGIYLAEVALNGSKPRVLRCEYHETEQVPDLEQLKRIANLSKKACTTLLSPGDYQMMMVEAPNVPVEELKTAVRWKIKDSLSYSVDAAMIDVLQIPANKARSDRSHTLYAITAPNDVIQKRMDLFEHAKIKLEVIEIRETAQRNIAALYEQKERALALLAFDDEGGLLTFTSDGELYLSRRIDVSVGQLCDANEELRVQYHDRVELELQRSLDYFDRQFNHLAISRLLLSAPEAAGLQPFLANAVDVTVEMLDLSQVMDISAIPALADAEFVRHVLPALGAAFRKETHAP